MLDWFKKLKSQPVSGKPVRTPRQEVLDTLARTAQEMRPWLRVVEKRFNPETLAYELVLAKGMDTEKISIPIDVAHDWLENGDRAKESEIREVILEANDRIDSESFRVKEVAGLWDWTGPEKER